MEMKTLTKDFFSIQKQAVNNFFDAWALFQNQTERTNRFFNEQMGINEQAQEAVDQWRTIFKDGRDESRRLINDGLTRMEDYFAALDSPDKKKSAPKT